ncbi:MAG: hypothetical protein NWR08_09420 [Opitutales bacterium]|nr:hypothetical protein [Opitutales bacterium]
MKSILCLSAGLVGASAVSLQAVPFADIVGSDVQLLISVRSLAETSAAWEKHAFAEFMEDDAIKDFFTSLSADESDDSEDEDDEDSDFTTVMNEEFGMTWDDFYELFPGQMNMGFYNITEGMLDEESRDQMVLMAECTGDAERMRELMQIQFERNAKMQKEVNPLVEHEWIEEQFMGETLYFDETFDGEETYIEDGYALVDGVFILATPEERLRNAVEAVKTGAASPLSKSDVYLRSLEASGRGDFRLYVNLSPMMAALNDAMVEQAMAGGMAMFGVTGPSLESALSLETMQALFVDMDLVDEGILVNSGIIYSEKKGMLSLLTYSDADLPAATYVPEGVMASSVSSFDMAEMIGALEKVITAASPTAPMLLDIQLQSFKTNTGVDLRSAILENIGAEVVSLSIMGEAGLEDPMVLPEQMYVFAINDAESFSQALETFKDMAPGLRDTIKTQDYEGQTIHTIKGVPDPEFSEVPAQDISYVITRSELIVNVGSVGFLHEVLSRMNESSAGFWQSEKVEQMFESIAQPNPVTRSYIDVNQMAKPFIESIAAMSPVPGFEANGGAEKLIESLNMPLYMISESNEEPDGLFARVMILKGEESK